MIKYMYVLIPLPQEPHLDLRIHVIVTYSDKELLY